MEDNKNFSNSSPYSEEYLKEVDEFAAYAYLKPTEVWKYGIVENVQEFRTG